MNPEVPQPQQVEPDCFGKGEDLDVELGLFHIELLARHQMCLGSDWKRSSVAVVTFSSRVRAGVQVEAVLTTWKKTPAQRCEAGLSLVVGGGQTSCDFLVMFPFGQSLTIHWELTGSMTSEVVVTSVVHVKRERIESDSRTVSNTRNRAPRKQTEWRNKTTLSRTSFQRTKRNV